MDEVNVNTGLAWAVKQSFVRYVGSDPTSETKVVAGAAELAGGGGFYFSPGEMSKGRYGFRGALQFRGHGGMLQVVVVDPVIDIADEVLLVRVDNEGTLRPLVDLDLPEPVQDDGVIMWQDVGTTLREESTDAFGGVYPAGTPFDPLTFRIPAEQSPE